LPWRNSNRNAGNVAVGQEQFAVGTCVTACLVSRCRGASTQ